LSVVIFCLTFPLASCLAIDAWPAGSGTTIATYSDASGLSWHEARQSLFVVQNTGTLQELDANGALKDSWSVAGDLEGITLAESDRYLYIGIEYPEEIVEFDLQAEALTGKSWNLHSVMNGTASQGLEGLAYRDGYFLAGHQGNGKIYVFNVNLNVSGDVSYVETITPHASYSSDISGLEYNADTGMVYVEYDSYDALLEMNSNSEISEHYSLPGTAQEGFTLVPNCLARTAIAYIANDDTGVITKHTGYPVTCLDADGDGVQYTSDCNDYDVSISANQTYYRDIDGDGLGDANTTTSVCSFTAPEGYVSNSNDPADISGDGRYMTVNGIQIDLFGTDISSVGHTDLNFYSDDWHEIVAIGLASKKAYISLLRVKGSEVYFAKRVRISKKKKYTSATISTDPAKYKFTTRFSRGKKYTWKVASSGSFKKSK